MDNIKLEQWKERLSRNQQKYDAEVAKMDNREKMYLGDRKLKRVVRDDMKSQAVHVRNICAELVESCVSSSLPHPKVTARRPEDAHKAKLIEDMIRNEMDRLPMEYINDMMERTVPIQGGALFLLEWDNTQRTHFTVGELNVTAIHPKMVVPQDGVYSGIEDMDYIILKVPQTKEYIRRKYDVNVDDEHESEPDVKNVDSGENADDLITQYIAYYRNDNGGIGIYSWVNETELEDIPDYQARRLKRCSECGEVDTGYYENDTHMCKYCHSTKFEEADEEYEEIYEPIVRTDGTMIPGAENVAMPTGEMDMDGMPVLSMQTQPTKVPYYKPNIYPLILQKNVSLYGKFLGDSDLDKIQDQQNTINRIESKIIDKLLQSGSYITLPDDASIRVDSDDMKVIRPGNAANKQLIGVYDLQGNISEDLTYLNQVYEEARQIIGITDSFQGRHDATATSGKAKEFAAAQSAGRLESKRTMKDAAYASLFEAMFKFMLAYADEPRVVRSEDLRGNPEYEIFNRYDFLEQDDAGNWCWNDQFLFSVDTAAPLASNREAMWQETRLNFQTGAFGNPQDPETLILFWKRMEELSYPGASNARAMIEQRAQAQQAMMQQQMAMQQAAQRDAQAQVQRSQQDRIAQRQMGDIDARAKADAARAVLGQMPQQGRQMNNVDPLHQ